LNAIRSFLLIEKKEDSTSREVFQTEARHRPRFHAIWSASVRVDRSGDHHRTQVVEGRSRYATW
jgi:hypothetical protein